MLKLYNLSLDFKYKKIAVYITLSVYLYLT
jgi:hypothetical protein